MKRYISITGVVLILISTIITVRPLRAFADQLGESDSFNLIIRQVKVGDGGSITLEAVSPTPVLLSDYKIGYHAKSLDDTSNGQQLPSLTLQPGQAIILTNDVLKAVPACSAAAVLALDASLAKSTGVVGLWQWKHDAVQPLSARSLVLTDSFRWTDTKDKGTADVTSYRINKDEPVADTWYKVLHGDIVPIGQPVPGWMRATLSDCEITLFDQSITIAEQSADDSAIPVMPNKNEGLQAVYITELLPNPDRDTDITDEFIEIFNPNDAVFDLSGYVLRSGISSTYSYTIPEDTILQPHAYGVFYSEDTGLVLSNTAGKVMLYNTHREKVAESSEYEGALSGRSWAFNGVTGGWAWTTQSTPGGANSFSPPLIIAPAIKKLTSASATLGAATAQSSVKKTTTVKQAAAKITTAKPKTAKSLKSTTTKKSATANQKNNDKIAAVADRKITMLHPGVLAVVVATAIGYGLYEYRRDIANRIYQFRTNRAARRANRG